MIEENTIMRNVIFCVLTAALLCVGTTKDASATVTITLEWSGCGGGSGGCTATGSNILWVNPGGGQTLRLDVYLSHNLTQGIGAHTFSLNFDTLLQNEFNLGPMAQTEWAGSDVDPGPGVDLYGPFTTGLTTAESTGATAGRINSFESGGLINSLPANGQAYSVGTFTATAPARYRVGQVFFTTNGGFGSSPDIFSGAFNGLFDVSIDGSNNVIPQGTFLYGTASLNVPEAGTIALLGLGLVALVLARRRRV